MLIPIQVIILLVLPSVSGNNYLLNGNNFTEVLKKLTQESLGVEAIQVSCCALSHSLKPLILISLQ